MKAIIELAVQTLGPVLYVVLVAGAALGLVVGVMLLVDSERLMAWNRSLNRWYSTRRGMDVLEQPVDVKRMVYRWHRVLGVVVFAGAIYTLDVLLFGFPIGALVRVFRDLGNPAILSVVFETVRIFLIVGNVAALIAAAVLVFRPSLLKGLEAWGDRYYSSRESTKALDVMHYHADDFVRARPKIVGALVTLGSLYVLVTLGMLLR